MNTHQDFDTSSVRQRLEQQKINLLDRRDAVRRDLQRQGEPLAADFSEQAVQTENDEALAAIGIAADAELANIDIALDRLLQGKYGLCVSCGEAIDAHRLLAAPQAIRCLDCA